MANQLNTIIRRPSSKASAQVPTRPNKTAEVKRTRTEFPGPERKPRGLRRLRSTA